MSQKHRIRTESFTQDAIRFVGEADGALERAFKVRAAVVLRDEAGVERAYLVRALYDSASAEALMLCLRSATPPRPLLREIGAVFSGLFGTERHLDLLILDDVQEKDVTGACRPFYDRAVPGPESGTPRS